MAIKPGRRRPAFAAVLVVLILLAGAFAWRRHRTGALADRTEAPAHQAGALARQAETLAAFTDGLTRLREASSRQAAAENALADRLAALEARPVPDTPSRDPRSDTKALEAGLAAASERSRVQFEALERRVSALEAFRRDRLELASLRRDFPAAALAMSAESADRPGADDGGWFRRWLGGIATLEHGNRVLLGDAAGPALRQAGEALDRGDVAAALAALDRLDPASSPAASSPAAAPLAAWRTRARAWLQAHVEPDRR